MPSPSSSSHRFATSNALLRRKLKLLKRQNLPHFNPMPWHLLRVFLQALRFCVLLIIEFLNGRNFLLIFQTTNSLPRVKNINLRFKSLFLLHSFMPVFNERLLNNERFSKVSSLLRAIDEKDSTKGK